MTFKYYVCVNPEEGHEMNSNAFGWAQTEDQKNNLIKNIQAKFSLSAIFVYTLTEMQKINKQPTYAKYKLMENGEILPL